MTQKIMAETSKVNVGLIRYIGARSCVIKAMLDELDDAQVERIKARSEAIAGNEEVKGYVREFFRPSDEG
ncbi:hypothetical protein [Frigidibacter oleivorans]|uniref:hypothetical protein n=1 Tax=Frigidibacter oleivorans TaxID=2487129 RepID=UPI000F8EE804|nr:hypothetical protein [Frigidibacter oleivorans]